MTAITVVSQPKFGCVHIAVDAAMYRADHTVVAFGDKVTPIAHWPGVVTCMGNAAAAPLFGWSLSKKFATWDEMIEGTLANAPELPELVKDLALTWSQVILAGISAKRGPEAYAFQTAENLPSTMCREEMESSEYYTAPFKLVKLNEGALTPPYSGEVGADADFEGLDPDDDVETVLWSLHKILEMQRQTDFSDIGGIGGFGEITTVSSSGISQRIVARWDADKVGGRLRPDPQFDWKRWHLENPKPGTSRASLRLVGASS